jgi:hypothetical protein
MHKISLALTCCFAFLLAGCDIGHGHSHDPDGSHAPKAPAPQKPANHHKSID